MRAKHRADTDKPYFLCNQKLERLDVLGQRRMLAENCHKASKVRVMCMWTTSYSGDSSGLLFPVRIEGLERPLNRFIRSCTVTFRFFVATAGSPHLDSWLLQSRGN